MRWKVSWVGGVVCKRESWKYWETLMRSWWIGGESSGGDVKAQTMVWKWLLKRSPGQGSGILGELLTWSPPRTWNQYWASSQSPWGVREWDWKRCDNNGKEDGSQIARVSTEMSFAFVLALLWSGSGRGRQRPSELELGEHAASGQEEATSDSTWGQ